MWGRQSCRQDCLQPPFRRPFEVYRVVELESSVADFLTTLPCFFFVLVDVAEELVVVPAGVLVVVDAVESVAVFLPSSLVTVVLLESV
jgi:hypothetical protein